MNRLFKGLLVALFVQNVALLEAFVIKNYTRTTLKVIPYERESRKSYIYIDDNYPKFPTEVLWRKPIPLKKVEFMWLDQTRCPEDLPSQKCNIQMMEDEFIKLVPDQAVEIIPADEIQHCDVYVSVQYSPLNTNNENQSTWQETVFSAMDTITFETSIKRTTTIIPNK